MTNSTYNESAFETIQLFERFSRFNGTNGTMKTFEFLDNVRGAYLRSCKLQFGFFAIPIVPSRDVLSLLHDAFKEPASNGISSRMLVHPFIHMDLVLLDNTVMSGQWSRCQKLRHIARYEKTSDYSSQRCSEDYENTTNPSIRPTSRSYRLNLERFNAILENDVKTEKRE